MQKFDILDCTLRDGGYYTHWDFPKSLTETYFNAVRSLPISHVEVGYRSPAKAGYAGQYFHLGKSTLRMCRDSLRPDQKLAIMFNYKDITAGMVEPLLKDVVGIVDLVRFACPPNSIADCIELARPIKAMGFRVAINVMYMTKYADDISILAPLANAGDVVDYVALVDSHGGVFPDQISRAISAAVAMLPQPIGFHGHDNLSLAFANSCAAVEAGASMIDSTFTGMGRGAGNLKTELITVLREKHYPEGIHLGPLSQALTEFEALQREHGWGTNLAYMLSGIASLPQADVMDWLGTRRYQMDSIVDALLLQNNAPVDETSFRDLSTAGITVRCGGRPALVIGGGQSISDHIDTLIDFARQEGAAVIHSSMRHADLFAGTGLDQIFCLAGQEFSRLSAAQTALFDQGGCEIVTAAPPRFTRSVPERANISQVTIPASNREIQLGPVTDEPPLDLAVAAARSLRASHLYLAGFDGYADASLSQQRNARDVQEAIQRAAAAPQSWGDHILSLTPTLYDMPVVSAYALMQPGARHED